jgi:ATP-dependent HslUV protease subunit HslV
MKNTEMSAREIALEAMAIAADICIYSNSNIIVEEL